MAQSLSNIALGSLIKFGKYSVNGETPQDIIWRVVAKGHQSTPAYPSNSVTLMADKVLDFRAFDARHTLVNGLTEDVTSCGFNRYGVSNIDQWLNKDSPAGEWYTSATDTDQPPTEYTVLYGTEYSNRPGFLNAFSSEEKNAILNTTIRTNNEWDEDGYSSDSNYSDITRKVYLASQTEISTGEAEGAAFEWFYNGRSIRAAATSQARSKSLVTEMSEYCSNGYVPYWLRSPFYDSSSKVYCTHTTEMNGKCVMQAYRGNIGVRPVLNLPNTLVISDTTDSDSCYTIVWNNVPTAPSALNIPTIYGGKSNTISWRASTDPDGDSVSYELECSIDGGAFATIYSGNSLSCNHTVPYDSNTVQYRVRAVDGRGGYSTYTTSSVITVINNQPPVISGVDTDLGTLTDKLTVSNTITDPDGDSVTVTYALDGTALEAIQVTPGIPCSYSLVGTRWLTILNGTHTLTITATDSKGASSVRKYTFTKNVTALSILSDPMDSTAMPVRVSCSVTKAIAEGAIYKVEVCNNGRDASPTWEDATNETEAGEVHVFANKSKTADTWAVRIKVTVNRNGASGACYISAIGGNFD